MSIVSEKEERLYNLTHEKRVIDGTILFVANFNPSLISQHILRLKFAGYL